MAIVGAGGKVRAKSRDPGGEGRMNGGESTSISTFPKRGKNRTGYQEPTDQMREGKGTLVGAAKATGVASYNG